MTFLTILITKGSRSSIARGHSVDPPLKTSPLPRVNVAIMPAPRPSHSRRCFGSLSPKVRLTASTSLFGPLRGTCPSNRSSSPLTAGAIAREASQRASRNAMAHRGGSCNKHSRITHLNHRVDQGAACPPCRRIH